MLNMDFNKRVVIDTRRLSWTKSPMPGVWRKPLAREEAERGHATSVVRFEPGAVFASHDHPGGEEILVLEGTFSDERGNFSAGTYFRNPAGYRHAPFSEQGCVLLVKLHQFQNSDTQRVVVDTHSTPFKPGCGNLQSLSLHHCAAEHVALVRWPAGEVFTHEHDISGEIYIISGELVDEHGRYGAGTWIRSPHLCPHDLCAEQDTLLWVKVGHLPVSIAAAIPA